MRHYFVLFSEKQNLCFLNIGFVVSGGLFLQSKLFPPLYLNFSGDKRRLRRINPKTNQLNQFK